MLTQCSAMVKHIHIHDTIRQHTTLCSGFFVLLMHLLFRSKLHFACKESGSTQLPENTVCSFKGILYLHLR